MYIQAIHTSNHNHAFLTLATMPDNPSQPIVRQFTLSHDNLTMLPRIHSSIAEACHLGLGLPS